MPPTPTVRTERLLLRRWRPADRAPFAELNGDPQVREHFPNLLTGEDSDASVEAYEADFDRQGYGLWAVEVVATGAFIGFTGLSQPRFVAHFTPAVEVGWRLARTAWGHGYATEAGRAALAFGFDVLGLDEIVSMTTTTNLRSQAVMRRLGLSHDPADDFDHPMIVEGHPLRRHVLYRITADGYAQQRTSDLGEVELIEAWERALPSTASTAAT